MKHKEKEPALAGWLRRTVGRGARVVVVAFPEMGNLDERIEVVVTGGGLLDYTLAACESEQDAELIAAALRRMVREEA